MLPYDHFLFDLDGTLTDPSMGIVRCYQYALARLGEPPAEDAVLRRLIGPPLRAGFSQILQDPTPERVEEAVRLYRERFAHTGIFEAELTPGAAETLAALRAAGKTLWLTTSKMQEFAEITLEHFGIDQYFEGVFGGDLAGASDDKARIVANCIAAGGLEAENSIMIGDRRHDFLAAQAHGIPMIGVRYGFAEEGELEALGCLTIVHELSDLPLLDLSNV